MKIWIIYTEWERSTDGQNAEISAVVTTEKQAREQAESITREWMADPYNKTPYRDPDTGEETSDWDFDVHAEEWEVGGLGDTAWYEPGTRTGKTLS